MPNVFFQLCRREWKRMFFDPRIVTLMFAVPFIYAFLFGGEYWPGAVQHIPIVIADQDHSHLSRDFTNAVSSSEKLKIYAWVNSPQDLLPLVRREKAYACVVIPKNFERDELAGKSVRVGVIIDGSNLLIGNLATRAFNRVIREYRKGISAEEFSYAGIASSAATSAAMPIQPEGHGLFNPTVNYSYFLLMGLVCVVIQQVTRMGSSLLVGLDGIDILWRKLKGPAPSVFCTYLAKITATAALVLPVSYVAISLPFVLYKAPFRGSVCFFLVVFSLYMVMQISIGYGFCVFIRSPVLALQLHMFMSVIIFILSGYTWPIYAMPNWIRPLSYITPLFHMNSILRKVSLIGAGPGLLLQHLLPLLVWFFIALAWGYLAVWKLMVRTKRAKISW